MIIFWRLVLAHLLADFTLQTNKIAEWKRRSMMGIFVHTLIFAILAFIFSSVYIFNETFTLQPLLDTWWRFPGWFSIIVLSAVHFVEDYYRVWSIQKGGSTDNVFFFLWDQFIHIFLIFLFVPSLQISIPEKFVMLFILLVLNTHFSTVLIYYLEEAVFGQEDISIRFGNKYFFILLRLIIFVSLLLPKYWMLMVIPAGFITYRILFVNNKQKFTNLNLILSFIISIVLGILAHMVIYG